MKTTILNFLLTLAFFCSLGSYANETSAQMQESKNTENKKINTISLSTPPEFSKWYDLQKSSLHAKDIARPFFGVINNELYVLGGSFFDKSPLEGGTKNYTNQIIKIVHSPLKQVVTETLCSEVLPSPMAEGFSITTPYGIFCVGGINNEGLSNKAFLVKSNNGNIEFQKLPDFPIKAKMMTGGFFDSTVYVFSGKKLYSLNLGNHHSQMQWKELPECPGPAREQAAGCIQGADQKQNALFIFGGFQIASENPLTPALTDAWQFNLQTHKWSAIASLFPVQNQKESPPNAEAISTIGAIAIPSGCQSILLIGGFNKVRWDEDCKKLASLKGDDLKKFIEKRGQATPESFNWNKKILVYNTVPNSYTLLPSPMTVATCGSAVAIINHNLVVFGGEVKPAQRSNLIQIANLELKRSFGILNWIILIIYLSAMLPFGYIFMRRGKKSSEDYFKGGGRIPWWVNGFSIYATMLSSITFMTVPALTYITDFRYFPYASMILVMAAIVIFFYLPFFRRLKITSAYELLEKRFNLFTRLFASSAFIIFMVLRSAIVTYLPALALSAIAGIDIFVSIILVGVITIIYSSIGGVEAVVWSDFIQSIILVGGAILSFLWLAFGTDGGFSTMFSVAESAGKLQIFEFGWDWAEPVFIVMILGGLANNLSSYTSDQTIVQRYLTTKDEKGAAKSIWLNGIMSIAGLIIFYLIGTGLYSYYHTNPALFDFTLYQNDAIFPTFMVTELPQGLSGLLIAAIFAATMSTLSSNFNSGGAAFVTDFYQRFFKSSDKKAFRVAIASTATIGFLSIIFAILLALIPDIKSLFDTFQSTIGILTGGLGGIFLMAIFIPRINTIGALSGLFASYAVNLILAYGHFWGISLFSNKPHALLYGAIGLITCLIIGYLVSLMTGKPSSEKLQGMTWFSMDFTQSGDQKKDL